MKKILFTAIIAGIIAISSFSSAFAGQWEQDQENARWKYLNDAGTYLTSGWQWIDGNGDRIAECYYFDENGYCLVNTITPDNCMVDVNGAWIVEGIVQTQAVETTQTAPVSVSQKIDPSPTEESNWTGRYLYVPGMVIDRPSDGSFWTVNISTGKYHGTPYVDKLLPENTRYFPGDAAILETNGYSRCKKNGCK